MMKLVKMAQAVAVLSLALSIAAPAAQAQTLVIKGSDTIVNLSQEWAEAFMKQNPRARISVTGGGSGTGIAALLNGTADLANASRAMKSGEIAKAKDRGFSPMAHVVGLDGLAVVVHRSNPVRSLSLDQIGGIFTGRITDWSQVGGRPGRIVILSRESNSGTFVYFKEVVMGNRNYSPAALLMPSTKAIQQELSGNPNAIGYGGEAYFRNAPGVKILAVSRKRGGPAVLPSDATVENRSYPIARPLYVYSKGQPRGLAAQFLRFAMSPTGQQIVNKVGYTPLR